MMKKQIKRMVLGAAVSMPFCVLHAEIDYGSCVTGNEPRLYVDRYGMDEPIVISNGYLFVEFDYIPPPLTLPNHFGILPQCCYWR